jgi:SAM-dependent methyltransferase
MSVSAHFGIEVEEYDALIRSFVPTYDELIDSTADVVKLLAAPAPMIVDLGIGTGALAAKCLALRPDARLTGIDADETMLRIARSRLINHPDVRLVSGDFLETAIPECDAIVACISLHHIQSAAAKQTFYAKCFNALRPGGVLVSGDYFPARDARLAVAQFAQWRAHLEQSYSRAEAEDHFVSWSKEDMFFPMEDELDWLRSVGLKVELVWRVGGYAVLAGLRTES